MKNVIYFSITIFLLTLIIVITGNNEINAATANDTMVVEVNLIGFTSGEENPDVGIEVSPYVFLENVTKDKPVSDDFRVDINNTGNLDITVTPDLIDPNEEIFNNLYFRTRQGSSDPTLNVFYKIGNYHLDIDRPLAGKTKRSAYCYISLNLTGNTEQIEEDIIGYQKEIVFWAMSR
jgi:hypothetical protein